MRIEVTTDEFVDLFGPKFAEAADRANMDYFGQAIDIALDGARLNAIKLLRDKYGLGLKDAKDIIDLAVPSRY